MKTSCSLIPKLGFVLLPPLQSTELTFSCFPLVNYNEIPLFCLYLWALDFWEWKKLTYLLQPEFGTSVPGERPYTQHPRKKAATCSVCYSHPREQAGHISRLWNPTCVRVCGWLWTLAQKCHFGQANRRSLLSSAFLCKQKQWLPLVL